MAVEGDALARTRVLWYLAMFITLGAGMALRLIDLPSIAETLWLEDGLIFVNQSFERGIGAFWIPHGGYIFVFHRIVALIAQQFPLAATPYILFFGWILSFTAIVVALCERSAVVGLGRIGVLILALAILLQPNHGEPFFNLNHSNFFFGIALAIYVCIPARRAPSAWEVTIVLIASLTGPFSVFFLPAVAVQLLLLRDFSLRKGMYIAVAFGAAVQALYLIESPRVSAAAIPHDLGPWLQAFGQLLSFGSDQVLYQLVAALFWMLGGVYAAKWMLDVSRRSGLLATLPIVLLIAVTIMMLPIGVLGTGGAVREIGPLDMCSRYFLIPYSLSFAVALISTARHRTAQGIVAGLLGLLCFLGPLSVFRTDRASSTGLLEHSDMQWSAFAKFHEIKPDLLIPINANWPTDPPWIAIRLPAGADDREASAAADIVMSGDELHPADGIVQLDLGQTCSGGEQIAAEIDVWRERQGWATMVWGKDAAFSSPRSLSRFYRSGLVTMQFAANTNRGETHIKLSLAEGVTDSPLVRSLAQFRPNLSSDTVIAEPTSAGGAVRVEQVRIYCL